MNTLPTAPDWIEPYLSRIGIESFETNLSGLTALQVGHLRAVPFHNLMLLGNDGAEWPLQPIEDVVKDAVAGMGGTCDRTNPPFCTLLAAVGFDVQLAAATVREKGDHVVCVVWIGGERYLCDVGNGHPYLRPWSLDAGVQEQTFCGWTFRFDPGGADGPTLWRRIGSDTRRVYIVDPSPVAYTDFAPMVRSHYTRAGYGPFLTGLRAVRIRPNGVWSLRDGTYARDTRFGRFVRRVGTRAAANALLTETFEFPSELVGRALDVYCRRRPEVFSTPSWFSLGRGTVEASADAPPAERAEVPDILVSVATIGRDASVRRLIRTLAAEKVESGYPGRVGVLLVENVAAESLGMLEEPASLPIHRVGIRELLPELQRTADLGLIPAPTDLPVPIGSAREAQLVALRRHLAEPVQRLPHPAEHPTVVWMLDDDLAFEQLGPDGAIRRRTHLLYRVARFWSELPHRSVLIGTFTGDPPVPGLDCLGGQLDDLIATLARMRELGPGSLWMPPSAPLMATDPYYDLAQGDREAEPWPYRPQGVGSTREAAVRLTRELPSLLEGRQVTRPLTWNGTEAEPCPSLRRGGNTVFLDLDALFRWPTPTMLGHDGVATRRADTLWATLAAKEAPGSVVEVTLPLLHGREGQVSVGGPNCSAAGPKTAGQVRGVALARSLTSGRPVSETLREREELVRAHRVGLLARLERLTNALRELERWGDAEVTDGIDRALGVTVELRKLVTASMPTTCRPEELQRFLDGLDGRLETWRSSW